MKHRYGYHYVYGYGHDIGTNMSNLQNLGNRDAGYIYVQKKPNITISEFSLDEILILSFIHKYQHCPAILYIFDI